MLNNLSKFVFFTFLVIKYNCKARSKATTLSKES
jgi:hypothetical protein